MNANEIADELDGRLDHVAANMLRQQSDRIRNLEKSLGFKNSGYETINLTPQLELTDDEIIAIVNETLESWNSREAMLKFARSLLRKARGDV